MDLGFDDMRHGCYRAGREEIRTHDEIERRRQRTHAQTNKLIGLFFLTFEVLFTIINTSCIL